MEDRLIENQSFFQPNVHPRSTERTTGATGDKLYSDIFFMLRNVIFQSGLLSRSYTVANEFETHIYSDNYVPPKESKKESNKKFGESIIMITLGCSCTITFKTTKKAEKVMVIGLRSILVMRGVCRKLWKFHITAIDANDDNNLRTITLHTDKIFDEEMLRRCLLVEPIGSDTREKIEMRLNDLSNARYSGNSGDFAKPSREELSMGVREANMWETEVLSVITCSSMRTSDNQSIT